MVDKKSDPAIEALQAVHAALKPLSEDERIRVLASVYALLGMQGPPAASVVVVPSPPVPKAISASPTGDVTARSPSRPVSINELMKDKNPGTNAQRITLFAYYRDKHEGLPRFNRSDIEGYFARAKENPPGNYGRDFVEAVKNGWIHEDGDDSYITSKGIELVESGFTGERKYAKVTRKARPHRQGTAGAKSKTSSRRKTDRKR